MEKKIVKAKATPYTESTATTWNVLPMTSAEVTSGITTHRGNKEAHVGAIDTPRPDQLTAILKAELLEKANKAKVLTNIFENLRKLAVMAGLDTSTVTMVGEDTQVGLDTAHPPEKTCGKRYQSEEDGTEGDLQTHFITLTLFNVWMTVPEARASLTSDLPLRVSGLKRKASEINLYVFSCLQLDKELTIICSSEIDRPAQ